MTIEKCNKYRTRIQQAMPRTCEHCGLGPCPYSFDAMSEAAKRASRANTLDPSSPDYIVKTAVRPSPKLVVHAVALERIESGDMVRIETDLHTGMSYARKS